MKLELLNFLQLENFPSGSGIEFYDDKIYVVGNDSPDLLVMSKKWNKSNLINIFGGDEKRASTPAKSDLASMTVLPVDKKPHLLIIGSGSTAERNGAMLMNLKNNSLTPVDLSVFYNRIRAAGIADLNIEGISQVYDYLVLVNRGNAQHPGNHLIITKNDFWKNQEKASLQTILVDFQSVGVKEPVGISGLTYSDYHEDLFITVSSEKQNAAEGKDGKSYLAVIENIYRKIGREKGKIKVNQLIDLPATDERFAGYTIESVCVQTEKDHSVKLQLIADQNGEKTFLFKVLLSW